MWHTIYMKNNMEIISLLAGGAKLNVSKPKDKMGELVAEERELAEALLKISQKYGKFNQDGTGVWAGYTLGKDNDNKGIGVKCANCVLFQGGNSCAIISAKVEPEGMCRFAIIPDGVVKKK